MDKKFNESQFFRDINLFKFDMFTNIWMIIPEISVKKNKFQLALYTYFYKVFSYFPLKNGVLVGTFFLGKNSQHIWLIEMSVQ